MEQRLIDAELLKKNCKITGTFDDNFKCVSLADLGTVIDQQPTVGMMPKKEIPKAPILITDAYGNGTLCCPNCKEPARSKWIGILPKYCQECGQKFKWEE